MALSSGFGAMATGRVGKPSGGSTKTTKPFGGKFDPNDPRAWLEGLATQDWSGMTPPELLGAMIESGHAGRLFGFDALQGLKSDWETDPTNIALQEGLTAAQAPVVSEDDLSSMLAQSRNTLGQSFQNQQAGFGNRFAGQTGGVMDELQAAMRFGTLQQQSQSDLATRLQAKQMNRSGLENFLGLGNQFSANKGGFMGNLGFGIANLFGQTPGSGMMADLAGLMTLKPKQQEKLWG